MKRLLVLLAAITLVVFGAVAQPTILSPTNGQTLYVGDNIEIRWQSLTNSSANPVSIALQDEYSYT